MHPAYTKHLISVPDRNQQKSTRHCNVWLRHGEGNFASPSQNRD